MWAPRAGPSAPATTLQKPRSPQMIERPLAVSGKTPTLTSWPAWRASSSESPSEAIWGGLGRGREAPDAHRVAGLARLLLREPERGDLGGAVGGPGDEQGVERMGVPAGDHLGGDDPLVAPLVSQQKAADHVADGVDPLLGGPQVGAGPDESALQLDRGGLQADPLGVR